MTDSRALPHRPLRRRLGAALAAAIAAAAAMVLIPASPAAAHHGWDGFDTDHLVYLAGTVSSNGSWGEPHSLFDVTLDSNLPADTPELEIPVDLQDPEDSTRVDAALSYEGPNEGLEVIIAPPAWSGRWGLDRALEVGESFQAVGYINRTDEGLFRPVVFWYGDDNVPVNQVLGSTLPVRAPLPEPAASTTTSDGGTAPTPSTTSTAPDPLEVSAPDSDASSGEDGADAWVVWTVFGIVIAAGIAGGFVYLRSRARKS